MEVEHKTRRRFTSYMGPNLALDLDLGLIPTLSSGATMAVPTPRKKRPRRRKDDKAPISTRLVLPDHMKGDVGAISGDLFRDLFPHSSPETLENDDDAESPVFHIAITPWTPNSSATDTPWAIVPVVRSSELPASTVRFSPSSSALQTFAKTLQQVAPSKLSSHIRSGIDILALDVVALELDAVYVKLESELTKRLENGEGTFYRDRPADRKGKGRASGMGDEPPLQTALRIALGGLNVIHTGDLFSLPLPPHPVTHIPPNPGEILLCEPVSQGILSPNTKIILSRGRIHAPKRSQPTIPSSRALNDVQEDDEDTSNDQFYSAAEDRDKNGAQTDGFESVTEAETDSAGSSQDDEDELSDDSMDEMISLQAPTLPPTCASGVATLQPGTPMTIGRGRKTNGMSTPGALSVYSSFTASTARPDRQRGRLFKAHGLMAPIPEDLLHPKPSPEDDEEARVYVDVTSLSKIGCFSGDWVRIEASEEPPANGFGAFGLGSFNHAEAEESNWRPVRVYSLPESHSRRPMTRIPSSQQRHAGRRLSFFESQVQKPASPAAYVSPILQANLDNASYVRLSALKKGSYQGKGTLPKFTNASRPPDARDIRIHRIKSPVTTEGAYQTAVLGGIKRFFSRKIRLLRTGDVLAIPIDAQLGKAMQEAPGSAGGTEVDDVVALSGAAKGLPGPSRVSNVAWFKVDHIQVNKSGDDDHSSEELWGSVASVDSSSVVLNVSGFETSRIPGAKDNNWEYYLGLKKVGRSLPDVSVPPSLPEPEAGYITPVRRQLRELMATATSQRAIHLNMPPVAILLVSAHRDIGKATVVKSACADIGLHSYTIDCYDILSESGGSGGDVKTEAYLSTRADRAVGCGPDSCALLIRHIETLTAERIATSLKDILQRVRVLVATTNEVDKLPDSIRGLFTHELELRAPDEAEREATLKAVINDRGVSVDPAVDLGNIALKTAALVAGDLVDVVDRAVIAQQTRLEHLTEERSDSATSGGLSVSVRDVQVAGGPFSRCLTKEDFDLAVDAVRKNFSDAIGAAKIPNVRWADVGGLTNVKDAVTETIQLPLERPELFARGMKKRSGILFYGPPGTGKTLLAKAIATEYSLNFLSVKGPELLNMYIGESEANVRRVFQKARDARPCVVFFDELDSVAPKRGNQGDSGGVMDRIVSQLLAELDGMSGGDDDAGGVFVIGATNRPDLLDPALLRPGRFDKLLYLGVSDTREKQVTILEALTRKFTLHPSVILSSVAAHLPFTYTGADFYALCSDAMLKAVTRQAAHVDARVRALCAAREASGERAISTAYFFDHYAEEEDLSVLVTEADFIEAQRELVPSVSAGELAHYERVRSSFEGATSGSSGANGEAKSPGGKGREKGRGKGKERASEFPAGFGGGGGEEEVGGVNGSSRGKGKGKGKAVAGSGFQEGTASDDDGLY
ncbi:probable peroxin-6 [Cephalotrichum gorgonifer]|uniref:Peroxisomal ATPase PEX6 n=1 Tax=Cephalotrichum gorgonifer TaxID=2041049 RepID=A0AAE8SRI4_9PEZI|nr:probable peroxin-6 [Cephalotrichum gorgonifer]